MSDMENIVGKLIPTGKTIEEFVLDNGYDSDCDASYEEYFNDEFYRKAIEIDEFVYEIESKELEDYGFSLAKANDDGTIEFHLRFYNGGCDFNEALESALGRL